MAYDDGFYYGQCRLICTTDDVANNGKQVLVVNGAKTYSNTIANLKAEFLVPCRGLYEVMLLNSGGTADYQTTVEAGYGDCIEVHLATGYDKVMQKDLLSLTDIKATSSLSNKGASAQALKDVDARLTDSLGTLKIGVNGDGAAGYYRADGSFTPFTKGPDEVAYDFYIEGSASASNSGSIGGSITLYSASGAALATASCSNGVWGSTSGSKSYNSGTGWTVNLSVSADAGSHWSSPTSGAQDVYASTSLHADLVINGSTKQLVNVSNGGSRPYEGGGGNDISTSSSYPRTRFTGNYLVYRGKWYNA